MTNQTANSEIQIELKNTLDSLIESLSSLTDTQLNQLPFEGSWTAGQLGDHLLKSYARIETMKTNAEAGNRPADKNCASIKGLFLDFSKKFPANPFIIPDGGPFKKEELIGALRNRTNEVLDFVQNEDLSKICKDIDLPGWGYMSSLEWITLFLYHTQRHLRQLEGIKKIIVHS